MMNPESGILKKAKSLKSFAAVLGIGLAIVSTVFTVKLMVTFGTSGFDKVLYGAFGVLIQAAQTALYVYAAYALWVLKDTGKAIPGFALFVLLFFLSLAGSIGSFVVSNRSQNVQIEKTDKIKETYDSELASIDKDAASVNKQLESLKSKGVVTKAKGTEEKAEVIVAKRSTLFDGKRHVIASESNDDPDALYKIIGEFFGTSSNSAKMLLFTLYAVALELASVILLSYSMIMFGSNASEFPDYDRQVRREPERQREAGFAMKQSAPATARMREPERSEHYDESGFDQPAPRKPEKKIGFVIGSEKPESGQGYPNRDSVLDALQAQIAEMSAQMKAQSQRPAYPPATSKEEAAADEIMDRIESLNRKFTAEEGHDGKESGSGSGTSTGKTITSTGIPVTSTSTGTKPVPVPVNEEDDMEIAAIMQAYIKELFTGQKQDGSLTGRAAVAKKLDISEDVARLVHLRLKNAGHIRVEGSKSFPTCTQAEMLESVGA